MKILKALSAPFIMLSMIIYALVMILFGWYMRKVDNNEPHCYGVNFKER